jgi:hypothetical protein
MAPARRLRLRQRIAGAPRAAPAHAGRASRQQCRVPRFIDAGGYREPRWWLSEGWALREAEGWQHPLYWDDALQREYTLGGWRELDPHAPVCHLSYYEADACARWAGARLPSEFEWEAAAASQPPRGHFADDDRLHPQAAGQWTAAAVRRCLGMDPSAYGAYPGFRPFAGNLGEYNGKFMCGQWCCAAAAAPRPAPCAPATAISSCRRRAGSSPAAPGQGPHMSTVHDALQALTDLTPSRQQILADVVAGLSRTPRQLPSKYFYDARGSRLFEQITQTREYYPTRTELALLSRVLPDIARMVGPHLHVVELGQRQWPQDRAAAGRAARPGGLRRSRSRVPRCCPASTTWPRRCPRWRCCRSVPTSPVPSPCPPEREPARRLLFFPGSTLGNFHR